MCGSGNQKVSETDGDLMERSFRPQFGRADVGRRHDQHRLVREDLRPVGSLHTPRQEEEGVACLEDVGHAAATGTDPARQVRLLEDDANRLKVFG
jgi:hypothetical protein